MRSCRHVSTSYKGLQERFTEDLSAGEALVGVTQHQKEARFGLSSLSLGNCLLCNDYKSRLIFPSLTLWHKEACQKQMFILLSWSTRTFSNACRIWTLTHTLLFSFQTIPPGYSAVYSSWPELFKRKHTDTCRNRASLLLPDSIMIVNVWTLQVPSCPESRMSWGDACSDKNNSLAGILAASLAPKKMCQEVLSWVTWHLSHAVPQLAFLTWAKETSTLCQ